MKTALGYVQPTMVHSAQLAVCNSRHSLQQRLARWLLIAHDQLGRDEIPMTHQCLSRALGVHRAGVTTLVGKMEVAGLLRKGLGELVVADRAGLEAQAVRGRPCAIECAERPKSRKYTSSSPHQCEWESRTLRCGRMAVLNGCAIAGILWERVLRSVTRGLEGNVDLACRRRPGTKRSSAPYEVRPQGVCELMSS
jgi:hypothetical protein